MSDDREYLTWEVWSVNQGWNGPLLLASFAYKFDALAYAAHVQSTHNWKVLTVVGVQA